MKFWSTAITERCRFSPRMLTTIPTVLVLLIASLRAQESDSPKRINVVMIIGDDHAAHGLGCYGNTKVRTPNLDRLASEGMRFERAYCNSPVCTASRQSLLTGRMPQSIGVTLLSTPLGAEAVTLAHVLGLQGYDTLASGKMHFNHASMRHGFDQVFEIEQAEKRLASRGFEPFDPSIPAQPPWRPFADHARVWLNAANLPWGAREKDLPDTVFAAAATAFIRDHVEDPFFLIASFKATHSPFIYPIEYAGRHDPKGFDPPEPGPGDADQIPLIFKDLTREEKQGITAAYHTSAEFLDSLVGQVLDQIQMSGLAENTLVIYLGDHGYNLGHHGRFEKHCFFEPAVRSPLIIRWPGRTKPGSVSNALVEFIDILPTVTEVCGVPTPPDAEGRSLVPVLEGKAESHRESVASVYFENEEAMIRDARHKLIYSTGRRERKDGYKTANPLPGRTIKLYDTESDPGELRDIAADPASAPVLSALENELLVRLREGRSITPPAGLTPREVTDLYLIPPEEQRKIDAELKLILPR